MKASPKFTRFVGLIGLSGLLAVSVTGTFAEDNKPNKKLVVGFSQVGAESGWRTANTDSIKSEAAKRGVDLRFSDAQQKQENQIKAIRSFIAEGVDVIAFSPVVETGFEPVLQEAKKAGIPVVLSDRAVKVSDPSLYACFLGSDFVEEGRRAAGPQLFDLIEAVAAGKEVPKRVVSQEGVFEQSQAAAELPKRQY